MPERVGGSEFAVADKDVARTFEESDVSITHSDTAQDSGAVKLGGGLIDDWEDGDGLSTPNADWEDWGGNGDLTAQQDTVISGDYSGELTSSNGFPERTIYRKTTGSYDASISVLLDADTGNSGDEVIIRFLDINSTNIGQIRFIDGGGELTFRGNTLLSSWDSDTIYNFDLQFDFSNNETTVVVNGTNYGTFGFGAATGNFGGLLVQNNTGSSGATRNLYLDDFEESKQATSGSAYIEWPTPDDVFGWDVATFTRTLDGETVEVYVEEAQGSPGWTEVAGPISRGDSIPADPSNNIRFRVDLSRGSTSNNPTLDSIARRWKL